jgi:murein DD-endopeptidase MepM/ murein hydrolase activator NlpD
MKLGFSTFVWRSVFGLALCCILEFGYAIHAQTQAFSLGFPIHDGLGNEVNPYSAPIISVVDHYADPFGAGDQNPLTVQAYTGEQGTGKCGSSPPCGRYNPNFLSPLNGQSMLHFFVNGNYTGTGADGGDSTKVLNYRGHSGIDFGYAEATQLYAPHEGDLFIPKHDPILDCSSCDPAILPATFNTFYIRDASGWSTWYLHTEIGSLTTMLSNCNVRPPNGDTCVRHVKRGDPIAKVGHTGVGCGSSACAHLHFEVRAACDFGASILTGCKVTDPYGWEWIDQDPLAINNPAQGMTIQSPLWNLSTWGLTLPQVTSATASITANTWNITINGSNFDVLKPVVTLWHRSNLYCFACGGSQQPVAVTVTSVTSTQITAQASITDETLNLNPGTTVVKVSNGSFGSGPRSSGTTVSLVSGSPTAYSLLLYKTPAPGGGVYLGFGGFHSATDDGTIVFNSGVDLNGDNVPDTFEDFRYGSAGQTEVTFQGFTQVFDTLINNEGDEVFAASSQPGIGPGIYRLPAGSSTPIKVLAPGDICPAQCPIPGSSVLAVTGPFAIGDAGQVAFSAEMPALQPTPTWILYLYSPSNGSYTKIVADGSGGSATPVGGYFTSQNFYSSVGIVASTGDVIFGDLVTGGTSSGGLFRYSLATGTLSKLVAQGDPAPIGSSGTLGVPQGSISGKNLVFYASVNGGNTNQIVGLISDTTIPNPVASLIAYQGEATGTAAGGTFDTTGGNPHLPFAFFGEGLGAPLVRKDGAVIFSSILNGATSSTGAATDQGLFLWNGKTITKIVVDGDQIGNGMHVQGVLQFTVNNIGGIYYFATTEN